MLEREERYKAAHDAHKHYDNLSLAVVTGIITLAAALLAFTKVDELFAPLWVVYLACAIVSVLLFFLYDSFSRSASIARAVACEIEEDPGSKISISKAYLIKEMPNPYDQGKGQVYKVILSIVLFISLGMSGLSYYSYTLNKSIQPTANASAD